MKDSAASCLTRCPRKVERIFFQLRYGSWFKGKEFSTDWTSYHYAVWTHVLSPLRKEPLRILEIGSWEGRSTLFFLNFFLRSSIVCIDTFLGNSEERAYLREPMISQLPLIERRFDRNVAPFLSRIEKIKSESYVALKELKALNRVFDVAHIDGSHLQDDVAADSAGVWEILAVGGIIIWDDYEFALNLPLEEQPKPAIDAFLREHEGRYRILAKTKQVIIERLDD